MRTMHYHHLLSILLLLNVAQTTASTTSNSILINTPTGSSKSTRSPFLVLTTANNNKAAFLLRGGAGDDDDDNDENNNNNDNDLDKPLQNLQVMLRGTKYTVNDVTTVQELMHRVQQESGNDKPHDVLFGGKRLQASDNLRAVGVQDGAQLNMVPATSSSSSSKTKNSKASSSSSSTTTASATAAAAAASVATASTSDSANAMQEYLKSAGVDQDKLNELMKSLGDGGSGSGSGGAFGGMPDLNESLDMMNTMMNSPLFQEYMSNPEMLEQSRQMILSNPMLKNMMSAMPGMGDILNDAEAWKEAMQAAANIYKNMDPDQLKTMMQGMGGGAGGMPGMPGMGGMGMPGMGMPPGLFDGTLDAAAGSSTTSSSSAATAAALDELDEDD